MPRAPPIVVRRALPDEARTIAQLFIASRRAAMPWLAELHGLEETTAFFSSVVPARREIWIATDGDVARGFIAFGHGEIEHLYVAPGQRGRGIGTLLLTHAQERSPALELWVFARNHAAREFYERRGFRCVEETDGSRNEEREPDARYRWDASGAGDTAPSFPGPGAPRARR